MALVVDIRSTSKCFVSCIVSLIHRDKLREKTQIWSQNKSIASTTTVIIKVNKHAAFRNQLWAVQNVYIWFLHFPVSWTKTNTASIGDNLILVVRAMIFASIIQCCRWYYPQIKSPDCWLRALVQLVNTCCSVNIVIVSIRLTVAQETVKGVTIALWKSPRGSSSIKQNQKW